MPHFRAEIITPWTEREFGNELGAAPELDASYQLVQWSDVTAQAAESIPPDPNLLVVDAVLEESVLANIRADSRYHCLWAVSLDGPSPGAEDPDQRMPEQHLGRLRDFLSQSGLTAVGIDEAVGPDAARTRRQFAQHLKSWLKTRPQAAR